MRNITLEELLEAGCHFGHQVTRQNPKSREFVFEARDNIHIIDLEKTKQGLEKASEYIKSVAEKPEGTLLVLGSKRQAAVIIKEEIKRVQESGISDMHTVTARWIGGTFTNFAEITKNTKKLKDLAKKLQDEYEKAKYTKKEISLWDKERQKLLMYYEGVKDMTKIPDVIFIIDTHTEDLAVREANAMGVPIVGIVDTNADPDPIQYPIPANDDAAGSIQLITTYIIDAWIEGKKKAAKEAEKAREIASDAANAEEKKETSTDAKALADKKGTEETKDIKSNPSTKLRTSEKSETKKEETKEAPKKVVKKATKKSEEVK